MCSTASRSTPARRPRAEREEHILPYIGGTSVASTPYTVTNGIVLRETVTKVTVSRRTIPFVTV